MPFKIFSEISAVAKNLIDPLKDKASDVTDDLGAKIQSSKTEIIEKVNHVFHAGESGIVEDVNRLTHEGGIEVTIYASYGYMQNGKWIMPMRGRVHQKRKLPDEIIAGLVAKMIRCDQLDMNTIISRSQAFTDDSRSGQAVTIEFDSDPDNNQYSFPKSDLNGLIEREIELSDEAARKLQEAQASTQWLTFSAVSGGHSGKGRVKLIGSEGVSVISDIDDTIKETLIPGDKDEVLRRTLCADFQTAPGMAQRYNQDWADASFHYVSGGPWQLYRPLYDFLIKGEGGFPDGTFHMTYHPKNFLAEDTREILIETIIGSLGSTFNHKVNEIKKLMQRFPGRRFILVGDSGEIDPEIYRHVRDEVPGQVQEIWIRDVLNDAEVNPYRLDGMNVIKVEPTICSTIHHHQKLSMRLQEIYDVAYARNTSPPCS